MTMPLPPLPTEEQTPTLPSLSAPQMASAAICLQRIQSSCTRAFHSARIVLGFVVLSVACFGFMAAVGYAWSLFALKAMIRRMATGSKEAELPDRSGRALRRRLDR